MKKTFRITYSRVSEAAFHVGFDSVEINSADPVIADAVEWFRRQADRRGCQIESVIPTHVDGAAVTYAHHLPGIRELAERLLSRVPYDDVKAGGK